LPFLNDLIFIILYTVPIDTLCAANANWNKQGVTVAGSLTNTSSSSLTNLNGPNDILIDTNSNLFISDSENNRVVYWRVNATQGSIVAGTGFVGSWINSFNYPAAIVGEQSIIRSNYLYETVISHFSLGRSNVCI
jgi:hypothetical protein